MSLRSPTTFICLSLLGDSLLADARENDLRSATSYPCSSPGLMSSNGRWISQLRCPRKRRGKIREPDVESRFLRADPEFIRGYQLRSAPDPSRRSSESHNVQSGRN